MCFEQIITSPQFPRNYPNNVRCVWMLSAPMDERIMVKIVDVFIEESEGCRRDKVTVEDVNPYVSEATFCLEA
jgi:hypothetical protein